MRRRFWLGITAVVLVAVGSVLAAFLVYQDDRDDFDQMQTAEAVRAARSILERYPVAFPIELRFSAGDDALLSPAHARESAYVAVHVFEGMAFEAPFRDVEAVMREWGGRPHWGKRSFLGAEELAPRYPRWDDFAAIRRRLDPDGRFVNRWIEQTLL